MKRLALFWLICAAIGFAVAAGAALLLSVTVDGGTALKRTVQASMEARVQGAAAPKPREAFRTLPTDAGGSPLRRW